MTQDISPMRKLAWGMERSWKDFHSRYSSGQIKSEDMPFYLTEINALVDALDEANQHLALEREGALPVTWKKLEPENEGERP